MDSTTRHLVRIWPAGVLLFAMTLGCGTDRQGSPATTPGEATGTLAWLTTSTDAEDLADARRRAQATTDAEFESVFDGLGQRFGYVDRDTLALLQARRSEAVQRLSNELSDGPITLEATDAALVLCRLGDVRGRSYLARVLDKGRPGARKRVVGGIDLGVGADAEQRRQFMLEDDRFVAALSAQLEDDDPDVVRAAVQTCGFLKVPGAHSKFLELAKRDDVPARGRLLFWLSKGPLTAELLDLALRAAAEEPQDPNDRWGMTLLEAFARCEDAQLRVKAREELKRQLASWDDDGELGYRGDRLGVLRTLAETSGADDVAWLRETVDRERGYYRQAPLEALIRLEGPAGRERLLRLLADPASRNEAVDVASELYRGTQDEEVVRALAAAAGQVEPPRLNSVCYALLEVGGDAAVAEVQANLPRLGALDRGRLEAMIDAPSLEQLRRAVTDAGMLGAEELAAALSDLQDREDSRGSPGLYDFLSAARRVVSFDAESDMIPCRHDRLVQEFAAASGGKFQPEAVSEQWHRRHKDDFDANYTLRFILGKRLYEGRLRNHGDWYDVERTVLMINRALAEAGNPERFVALATGDQTAEFVFADPQRLRPLAEAFHLTLGDDLNEAVEAGQEFERRVLEELQNDGA